MISLELKNLIKDSLKNLGWSEVDFALEHPTDLANGDYATNVALVLAKQLDQKPKELAKQLVGELENHKPASVQKMEIAVPGFINFYLTPEFLVGEVTEINKAGDDFGKNDNLDRQKVMIEYTDPNPFKEFHIGHLMPNVIGEALSRIIEARGAEIKRVCYQGDVGLHVAKAVWGLQNIDLNNLDVQVLARSYAAGSVAYEKDESVKAEIISINKKIYDKSDEEINEIYEAGKRISLEYFDIIYQKLGTKFDQFFFESATGEFGKKLVVENIDKVFESSEGAVVFHGEKYDPKLHTRVFINSEGLPTYEAKELGLAKIKYDQYPYDQSIVVTGNEVNDYFRVMLKALEQIFPDLAAKTLHLSHGMLRLPSGKMSSRTGDVITAEALIAEVSEKVRTKIEATDREIADKEKLVEQVAIAAIKFSILRQAIGKDIIFDLDKSISFEGDSGPYLQYTYVRTKSILEKADQEGIKTETTKEFDNVSTVERLLYRFPEVIEQAGEEYASHGIITYLLELASAFNAYYAKNKIVDVTDPTSPYKVALTAAVGQVLKNGLTILAIPTPEKM